jgi:chemotaxis protein CheY-P-specific phosphatase CheC
MKFYGKNYPSQIAVVLSTEDAANILDALTEWAETIEPKELDDNEVGLNSERWGELKLRLKKATDA